MSIFQKQNIKQSIRVPISAPTDTIVRGSIIPAPKVDPSLFPEIIIAHGDNSNTIADIIKKYSLIKDVDYMFHIEYDMSGFSSATAQYRFKNKSYVKEINDELHRLGYINHCFNNFDKEIIEIYNKEVFLAKNNIKSFINFQPKPHKMTEIVRTIVNFYLNNKYDVTNAEDFKSNLLTRNENLHC